MEKIPIPKSQKAFEYRIIVFTASYIVLGLFVTVMIFNLSRALNFNEFMDLLVAGIFLIGIYLLFISTLWYQWQGAKYYLSPHALIIKQRTKGLLPSYSEQIYTLNNIVSAKISKSGYANKHNFGDITLFLNPGNQQVVLSDINAPENLSGKLSSSIGVTTMQQQTINK